MSVWNFLCSSFCSLPLLLLLSTIDRSLALSTLDVYKK